MDAKAQKSDGGQGRGPFFPTPSPLSLLHSFLNLCGPPATQAIHVAEQSMFLQILSNLDRETWQRMG